MRVFYSLRHDLKRLLLRCPSLRKKPDGDMGVSSPKVLVNYPQFVQLNSFTSLR
jgi:hypothetical protein